MFFLWHSDIKGFAVFWVQETCHLNAGEIHVCHFIYHIGPSSFSARRLSPQSSSHTGGLPEGLRSFFNLPPPYNHGLKVTYLCSLPSWTSLVAVHESQYTHQIQP